MVVLHFKGYLFYAYQQVFEVDFLWKEIAVFLLYHEQFCLDLQLNVFFPSLVSAASVLFFLKKLSQFIIKY